MDGSKILIAASAAFAALCATGIAVAASASNNAPGNGNRTGTTYNNRMDDRLAARMLDAHNHERQRLGLPKLKWNRALEREAQQWGRELASRGRLEHADRRTRNSTGENLWMGSQGQWDVLVGLDMMIDEKKHYRHGNFPEISSTGKWADVAHYTQIVWRNTQEVGCSVVNDRGWDVLVCRYWPAGNVWGQKAY
jgi:hypothetical protein